MVHVSRYDRRKYITSLQKAVLSANEDAINSFQLSAFEPVSGHINDIPHGSLFLRRDLECGTRKPPCEFDGNSVNNPGDLFYKDGKLAKRIFLLGEAGYGKTSFCLKLLSLWCNIKKSDSIVTKVHRFFHKSEKTDNHDTEWENFLAEFDLAIYVSLSHVGLVNITLKDMCCYSVFGKKRRQKQLLAEDLKVALQDVDCSSLIIIDSLDDWLFYQDLSAEHMYSDLLGESIMPNCTAVITSSPGKYEILAKCITPSDKVVELEGLGSSGAKTVFRNTLLKILGKETSDFYNKSYSSLVKLLKNPVYTSLFKAPVFASLMAHVLCQKGGIGQNWTELYCSIVDSLILRMQNDRKVKFNQYKMKTVEAGQDDRGFIPVCFKNFQTLSDFITNLVFLGRSAYDGLMSSSSHLKFEEHDLFDNIGDVIDFGIETGLLVETHPPSKSHCNIQIYHFLHKSIQEFLAALFVSYLKKDKVSHLLKKCNSLDKILEHSELLVFMIGLSPDLGAILSDGVMEVASSDTDMHMYRQTFKTDKEAKVEALFKLLTRGYRESMMTPLKPQSFHVTDAYLSFSSHYFHLPEDTDQARLTFDLLTLHHQSLLSLCLKGVPDDPEKGISHTELTLLLDKALTLKSLCIFNMPLETKSIRFSSLSVLSLWYITLTRESKGQLENALSSNSQLRILKLGAFFGTSEAKKFCLNLTSCIELCHLSLMSMDIEKLEVPKDKLDTLILEHVKGTAIPGFLANLHQFHMLQTLKTGYFPELVGRTSFLNTIPSLNKLHTITYQGSLSSERDTRHDSSDVKYDSDVVARVLKLSQLHHIKFRNIDLSECGLNVPVMLTELKVLQLGSKSSRIKMSNKGWNALVMSFLDSSLSYELHLYDTDIDGNSYQHLCSATGLQLKYSHGKFGVEVKKLEV